MVEVVLLREAHLEWVLMRVHMPHRPLLMSGKYMEGWRMLSTELCSRSHAMRRVSHLVSGTSTILLIVVLAEVLVALFCGKKDFAAFVAQLATFYSEAVLIVHFALGLLRVRHIIVVNKSMWAVLCVWLCLFHPNGSNTPILLKDGLKCDLVREPQSDGKSDKQCCTVRWRQVVIRYVTHDSHTTSVTVRKLHLCLEAVEVETLCNIIRPLCTRCEFEANERIYRTAFRLLKDLNVLDFSTYKEV